MIRKERWLNYALLLRVSREIITPVFSGQALRLDLPYQPLSLAFIKVRSFPYVSDILFWTMLWPKGFQPERRAQIPAWDVLLFTYGVFMVPVLFSLLVGITMSIWSNSRINYVFIFGPCAVYSFHSTCWLDDIELDVRTRLDYREYFEVGFLVPCPYHLLITRSDPGNTPGSTRLRILVFTLSYCQPDYLAAHLVGVRVCSYAKPFTYSVQVVSLVACEAYRWTTYQRCASGRGEYELSGRCTSL